MKTASIGLVAAAAAFAGFLVFTRAQSGGLAATPAVFSDGQTLQSALAESEAGGRPVLVVATADWCGPCQTLKRTALADPAVQEAIAGSFIPVYLEHGKDQARMAELGVSVLPTTIVLRNGSAVARVAGVVGPTEYLDFLETAATMHGAPAVSAAGG